MDTKNVAPRLKCGDIREDGMVFWSYQKSCKNGERWMTPEKFEAKRIQRNSWDKKNPEKSREKNRKYREKYPERVKESNKNTKRKRKDKIRTVYNAYIRNRTSIDPIFRLRQSISSIIRKAFLRKGFGKTSKSKQILGCSYEEFFSHIESQFQKGMNWDNRHLWHIDHIIPISLAKTEEDVIKLNHYTNLRPLWIKENQEKSDFLPCGKRARLYEQHIY